MARLGLKAREIDYGSDIFVILNVIWAGVELLSLVLARCDSSDINTHSSKIPICLGIMATNLTVSQSYRPYIISSRQTRGH
jgi:hypothetical protein